MVSVVLRVAYRSALRCHSYEQYPFLQPFACQSPTYLQIYTTASQTPISNNMPVQTRHTRTTNTPQYIELPSKNKRNLRRKPKGIKKQVYYSDQDIVKQQNKAIQQTKSIEEPQGISIENEEDKIQNDVKYEDVAKTCRPPPKRTRKGKQNNNMISNNTNLRSKQMVSEVAKVQTNLQLKIEHQQQQSKVSHKRITKTVPHPDDIIIPEDTISQSPIMPQPYKMSPLEIELQKERERRMKLQNQMEMLAKIDSEQKALLTGPFLVFNQYRSAIESRTEEQYRQFCKNSQNMGENVLRQKIEYSMRRERELRKHVNAEAMEKYKDMFLTYRQLEDSLFYRSKELNQQEMQEFKRSSQYRDILMRMMQLHPFNAYRHGRTKRALNLQITNAVSQNFVFTNTRRQSNGQRTMHRPAQISQQQSQSAIASNHNLTDRNLEGENQVGLNSAKNPLPAQINEVMIPEQLNLSQTHSRATPNYQQTSPEVLQRKKLIRKKFQSTVEKFVEPTGKDMSAPRNDPVENIGSEPVPEGYNRDRILKIIHSINEQSNLETDNQEQKSAKIASEKGFSQAPKSKTPSVKSQAITTSFKPSIKLTNSQHSQVLSAFELNQSRFQDLQQIEIRSRGSAQKGEQTTRHDHASAHSTHSRNEVKSIRYYNNNPSWESYNRNPKVKQRLQILNRFHYNPFEIQNGDDQCDLWRRLMSQEIDDLKSHYRYEEPNQYFLSQHQKYDKGYVLPLKVKEEDFFIPSRYDPSNKGLKEETEFLKNEQSNRQGEELSVKRQMVEQNGFAFITDLDVPSQVDKLLEGEQIEANERPSQAISPVGEIVPQESRLDQSGKSFNLDMLDDFWIPDPTQEKEPAKLVQLDLF